MTTWIKVMNSMPTNPKVLQAGDRAAWLFICGCCYANEHLTDGFIARHVLPVAAPGVRNPEALAATLVAARLWHEVDGGWQIHEYTEVQRGADEIRGRRVADAKRKADARAASGGSPRGHDADGGADSARNPAGVQTLDAGARRQKAEKKAEDPPTPKGEQPPTRPSGNRGRDIERFDAAMRAWAQANYPGEHPDDVAQAVAQVRAGRREPTAEHLEPHLERLRYFREGAAA